MTQGYGVAGTRMMDELSLQSAKDDGVDLSRLENTLGFLVRVLQVRSFRLFNAAFADAGLTPARHATLTLIEANPGIRQVKVASILGFHEPNMTKLVKEMEGCGWVCRVRSEEDARAIGLTLSPAGKALIASIEDQTRDTDRQVISRLSPEEGDMLVLLLRKALNASHRRAEASLDSSSAG